MSRDTINSPSGGRSTHRFPPPAGNNLDPSCSSSCPSLSHLHQTTTLARKRPKASNSGRRSPVSRPSNPLSEAEAQLRGPHLVVEPEHSRLHLLARWREVAERLSRGLEAMAACAAIWFSMCGGKGPTASTAPVLKTLLCCELPLSV